MVDNHHDHWSTRRWPYLTGVCVLVTSLAAFGVDWSEESGVSGWIESHLGLAAWVQAIGTLLALAIAIYVPRRLHGREAKERADDRRRQGQGIALVIRHILGPLDIELMNAIRMVKEGNLTAIAIDVPPLIQEQVSRLWLMGHAGEKTLRLVSKIDGNKGIMEHSKRLFDEARPLLEAIAPKDLARFLNMEEEFLESSPEIVGDVLKEFVRTRKLEEKFLESARKDIHEIREAIDQLLEYKP